ncbi:hypothetical protein CXB51_028594 [Gossypium anomalum]|uniref:Transposase n=1 Tax=Gossypium anomalum TaxID=47600 RepID=A0A8J5YEW7_9ROSI|nr:hypothetical protein CXB51_028594 [Gossypium anomalum]
MDLVMRIGSYGAIFVARSYLTSEEDCRNSGADVCGEGCVAEVILAFPIIISLGGGLLFSKRINGFCSGTSAGVGFAIPSSTVLKIVPQLIKFGKFCHILLRCTASLAVSLILPLFAGESGVDQVALYRAARYNGSSLGVTTPRKMRRRRLRGLSIVKNTPNSEEGNSEQQTAVGSSNVPETLDEPEEFQNPANRVKVSRNTYGQPVGSEARLLAGYIGILARNANMLPINYESWHHMPDSNKNQALANVKDRFALEVSDDYIKKTLGKKWRDNKSILKKQYFKKDISLEEKLRNVPPGMLRYQWEDAVRFWNSKKGEDRERVGISSRQKQKFTHTAGSRSFASVAEAEEVKSGQKVGRLQLFEITHKKKDGSPMTSEAGEIMEKLKDKKAEYEATASTDSSVNLENIDNRIITEVLGPERYGRVRFQGSGVTPTQYFGSGSQQYMPSGSQAKAEVQRLRDQMAQMQVNTVEQIAEVQRKYEELQQQLRAEAAEREAAAAAREAEHRKKYDDLQLQLQQMMQMFQQSQKPPS